MKNLQAVAEALTWLGTRYHHQGRVKGVGVDCGTLICEVYEKVGLIPHIPTPKNHPLDWHLHQSSEFYLNKVQEWCYEVKNPQPGDIVLYRYGKSANHGAIIVEWPIIVHANLKCGTILQDSSKGSLADHIVGFYRIKGG